MAPAGALAVGAHPCFTGRAQAQGCDSRGRGDKQRPHMYERYRVSRSFGGGYVVRQSDFVEEAAYGAAGLMGSLIGASIGGIATLAGQSRDRSLAEAIGRLNQLTEQEAFDDLL